MNSRIILALLLIVCMGGTSWGAKKGKKKGAGDGPDETIIESSPMSITLDAGNNVQESYKITDATKVTLDGAPITADDLRAGMLAKVKLDSDNQTAVSITAKGAPRTTKRPVVHKDNVWVNMK
jgi:hypothetical protein